ncbi:MAG TPA: LAGLIDADG family homing endonuclease [Nitrososphaerales archaeon]|nr:LAGLIDADG family homing endonuclease [Nitrososphaerales archaeon]
MRTIGALPGSWRVKHDSVSPELAKLLYPRVLELASKGQGPAGIARELSAAYPLSISPGTVRHWIVGDRNPQGGKVRNHFRQEPSPALSYVIGANIGDGCTLTDNWIVKLEVTDRDFAEAFNSSMATLFSRETPNKILIKRFKVERLPMYVVRYSSKSLVELLRLPLRKLLEIAFRFPREFLRGFFDAEGHVDVGVGNQFHLAVGAENSEKLLLSKAKQLLKTLGINSRIDRKRKAGSLKTIGGVTFAMRQTSCALMIGRITDIRLYAGEIGFSILRKGRKLFDAIEIIDNVGPANRPKAWMQLYEKKRGKWVRRESS